MYRLTHSSAAASMLLGLLFCCSASQKSAAQQALMCATTPDPAAPHVRALAGTCGTATFTVNAAERQSGQLSVAAAQGGVYIRTLQFVYAGTASQARTEMRLHKLFGQGDTTPSFPASRDGMPLVSVTVEALPPGHGGNPIVLALTGPETNPVRTGAIGNGSTTPSKLDGRDWVLAASATANLAERRNVLEIGRQKGRFEMLALSVRGQDLPIRSLQVVPIDGEAFSVDVASTVAAGTLSAPIAIDPPAFLRQVIVTYSTPQPEALLRRGVVEVHGRYSENWTGQLGENRQFSGGWLLLGTVDVVVAPHRPRTPLRIAGQRGPFKNLRFVARRGAIDLAGATIESADGRSETMAINSVLLPDQPSKAQGFSNGAALPIAAVSLSPRLHTQSRIDATIEVWAQY